MDQYRPNGRIYYGRNGCTQTRNISVRPESSARVVPSPIDCECKDNSCKDENRHMRHMQLGMAYVPIQEWGELYSSDTALAEGTAFPDLNLVFCGVRGNVQ